MLSEDTKILDFDQYHKSDRAPYIMWLQLDSNPEPLNSWTNTQQFDQTGCSIDSVYLFNWYYSII